MRPRTVAAVISLAILTFSGTALARLVVFGPETMLDAAADAIILAEIVSKQERKGNQPRILYGLRVEEVLAGQISEGRLTITAVPMRPSVPPPDMLPEPGTKALVLLRGEEGNWSLAADLNAVGIIADGRVVALHRGTKVGINDQNWTPENYVAVYQAFYETKAPPENDPDPTANTADPAGWCTRLLHWLQNLLE